MFWDILSLVNSHVWVLVFKHLIHFVHLSHVGYQPPCGPCVDEFVQGGIDKVTKEDHSVLGSAGHAVITSDYQIHL